MSVIQTRGHQLFPVLDASQIDVAKRFANGPARDFAPGEIVYDVAERYAPVWLVLKGSIRCSMLQSNQAKRCMETLSSK